MSKMSESEFNQRVDTLLLQIEEALDETEADLDYENISGILTIICENGSQVIVNRQSAAHQIWVATKSNGLHFDYDANSDSWLGDRDGAELLAVISTALSAQSGEHVSLN